ncbi:hypothetical protein AN936_07120 [Sphingopyxis macrogoltabida]|uniref:Uncharacterized protein n=1 Tax=Sphingopyxis macrogoltabida TaxID=33050 RepID=A0A0N9UYI9_SPHMC|nr:hypothetical protein AN936_07120 [Sphingopyxis macrogoltabida]
MIFPCLANGAQHPDDLPLNGLLADTEPMRDTVVSKIFKAVHQEHFASALRQAGYRPLDPRNLRVDMFVKSWNHRGRDQQVSDRAREAGGHVVLSHGLSSA